MLQLKLIIVKMLQLNSNHNKSCGCLTTVQIILFYFYLGDKISNWGGGILQIQCPNECILHTLEPNMLYRSHLSYNIHSVSGMNGGCAKVIATDEAEI